MSDRLTPAPTVYGRGLLPEVAHIANPPVLIVTMADLLPRFQVQLPHGAHIHLVDSLAVGDLEQLVHDAPAAGSIVGLGGGQALDVAKYLSWRRAAPLFLVPTSTSVNAAWGQRSAVRDGRVIRYVGWAQPQSVFVDFDIISSAPTLVNASGAADVLCYHTAHWDWRRAHERGRSSPRWPYEQVLVDEAAAVMQTVLDDLEEISAGSERGVRTLVEALRWGGAAFWANGWNPCPIEGSEHHFFYALEELTGRHFIHGQAVGLGIVLMSRLQDNEPARLRVALEQLGIDLRPEAMGVTRDDVAEALRRLAGHIERAGLWYTVAVDRPITEEWIRDSLDWLEQDA